MGIFGLGVELTGGATTDEQGEFSFAPSYKSDYKVVAMSVDGHRAEQEIAAGSLPVGLPEQLPGYENKLRVRDVVGGLGFICGLAGVAMYFAPKKKK